MRDSVIGEWWWGLVMTAAAAAAAETFWHCLMSADEVGEHCDCDCDCDYCYLIDRGWMMRCDL